MNRRPFLITLAALSILTLSALAQTTENYKPVPIGPVITSLNDDGPFSIQASDRLVRINNGVVYDIKAGKRHATRGYGAVSVGTWEWSLYDSPNASLMLIDDAANPLYFKLPHTFDVEAQNTQVRFSPDETKVSLLAGTNFFQWDRKSRRLERRVQFSVSGDQFWVDFALSHDGKTAINADIHRVAFLSTLTGSLNKKVQITGFTVSADPIISISSFGSYALYSMDWANREPIGGWRVVDTHTGRALWRFNLDATKNSPSSLDSSVSRAALSGDEKTIALPLISRKIWQVRDLRTGVILRSLPLLSGVSEGAFSPDGATLYSVAGGVLYRQRAR